jgi:hypothetical protein
LIVMVLAGLVMGLTLTMIWHNVSPRAEQVEYVKNEILVKFKEGMTPKGLVISPFGYVETGLPSIDFLNAKYGIDSMKPAIDNPINGSGLDGWYLFKSTKDFDALRAVREYRFDPSVEYAEPNYISRIL